MDAELWIYIILGIVYFLSRMFKKPEQSPGNAPERPRPARRPTVEPTDRPAETPRSFSDASRPSTQTRPMTFEELLREITEGKQTPQRAPEPEPPAYEAYEQIPDEEPRSLEEAAVDDPYPVPAWKAYEGVIGADERKSLEETMRLEDTEVTFGRFEAFAKKEQHRPADAYRKLLANPESLKQAVVLTEILNRRF